ncbi:MAG: aminoacyl--tRNA ligase-related protein [bacterium]
MRQSFLFTKTLKEAPRDEISANAKLLARAGFVDKLTAGVYSFLPLGLKVLRKIENIIREEMAALGGQEILMPALNPKENWAASGRWEALDVLFKLKGKEGKDYALAPTHEEIVVPLAKSHIFSYKDLPFAVFQIQDKFRDEPRARSGLLRGREFLMKDLYSFHADQKDLDEYYDKVKTAYFKIFERTGLGKETFLTLASGGTFSKYSHEFQTISPAGEDTIFVCQKCNLAVNADIKDQTPACPECGSSDFKEEKAIEVGNIFKLGTKYSEPFELKFRDKDGKEQLVIMGCYGIGPGRVMGTVVEISHDEQGIIWPKEIAPFSAHLITVSSKQETVNNEIKKVADNLEAALTKDGVEILYDDREEVSPGQKFAEADLIGIPIRIVLSEKTLEKGSMEIKKRNEKETQLVKLSDLKNLTALISSPASDSK